MPRDTAAPLPTRRLGRTGWPVTALGLGGYQYTGEFQVGQDEAQRILDLAFASGINYFDTAQMYGFGESEELLARALARHGRRGAYVSSKVGWLDRTVVRNLGDKAYRDESALLRTIKHSLWTLRLDRIDIFMVHEPDWAQWGFNLRTGDAPVVAVLERLKKEGVIGAIGMGGWNCDVIADLIETGRFDVALVAGGASLLQQPIRARVLPAAAKHDTGVILGGALGQGGLVAIDRPAAQAMINAPTQHGQPAYGRKLLAAYDLAGETKLSLVELAVRYVLGIPEIHTHVAGAREAAHLEANLGYVRKGPLPPDVVAKIEAIGKIQ
jgi:aryl-alcohol dehydrogenase-like predicted oxidoreductase